MKIRDSIWKVPSTSHQHWLCNNVRRQSAATHTITGVPKRLSIHNGLHLQISREKALPALCEEAEDRTPRSGGRQMMSSYVQRRRSFGFRLTACTGVGLLLSAALAPTTLAAT